MELTPGWMYLGTDYIASFPPFNNNQLHVGLRSTVDNVGLPDVVSKRWRAADFPGTGCTH